jgi:hypothetical protein
MLSLDPHDTGLSFAVRLTTRDGDAHDARVTATRPPWGANPAAIYAVSPFAFVGGVDWLSERQKSQFATWASMNAATLDEYWEGRTYYEEQMLRTLRGLRTARPRNFRLGCLVLRALAPKVRSIGWSDGRYELTFATRFPNAARLAGKFSALGFSDGLTVGVAVPKDIREIFKVGCEFRCGGKRWRCTDVGSRVITAVCLDDHPGDPSWFNGPPYAVVESVFDEYDQPGCEVI